MRNDIDDDSCSQLYGRISFCWSAILFGVITGHELSLSHLQSPLLLRNDLYRNRNSWIWITSSDHTSDNNNNQLILPPFFHFFLIISMIVAMQQHFLSLAGLIVLLLLLLLLFMGGWHITPLNWVKYRQVTKNQVLFRIVFLFLAGCINDWWRHCDDSCRRRISKTFYYTLSPHTCCLTLLLYFGFPIYTLCVYIGENTFTFPPG